MTETNPTIDLSREENKHANVVDGVQVPEKSICAANSQGYQSFPDASVDVQSTILAFKHKKHSLSINASSVASCVGYNEFQSIPELMLRHVYQGYDGQTLLRHDAQLLGLTVVSEKEDEEELMRIAKTSGSSEVRNALHRALKLKHGDHSEQQSIRSVDDAKRLKASLDLNEKKLRQKLTPQQISVLKEGMRQAVDTGCGNSWEDEALDRYEEQCGWEVRERNAECRHWHFEKVDQTNEKNNSNYEVNSAATIRPIAPAFVRRSRHSSDKTSNYQQYDSRGVKRKLPRSYEVYNASAADSEISQSELPDLREQPALQSRESTAPSAVEISINDTVGDCSRDDKTFPVLSQSSQVQNGNPKPFLIIKGMVDGIRDELGPTKASTKRGHDSDSTKLPRIEDNENDSDDDSSYGSFALSRVVVECKHRMSALLPNGPRFSESIQAVVYCFMYETDDADIVQVLRSKKGSAPPATRETTDRTKAGTNKQKESQQHPSSKEDFQKPSSKNDPNKEDDENEIQKAYGGVTPASDCLQEEPISNKDGDTTKSDRETNEESSTSIEANSSNGCTQKRVTSKSSGNNLNIDRNSTTSIPAVDLQLVAHRVSLDDPNFGHRHNWEAVLLPKLRQWVDAVYTIRESDDKRYRLLSAVSSMIAPVTPVASGEATTTQRKDHIRAAWELVFRECDFLRDGMSGEKYRRELR